MSPSQDSQPTPSQNTSDTSALADGVAGFPVAKIREAKQTSALFLASKMWWMTGVCLLIALWLTWRAIPSQGPTIVIRFPEGHGLKSGDSVRHRGIDVGTVSEVVLSEDLSQVSATVILTPEAALLAHDGTRFWIVRPQLSLTGVSGLETAVGAKYIAVSPGDPNGRKVKSFEGLSAVPPDESGGNGIDIVLRSDARHGITTGAPVAWRGVDVGQILSIHLSPDARFVDIHARIQPEFSRLLQKTSQFWVTSGLGVDVGLSGLHLNADSLSSIIRGGVSFATPVASDDSTPVRSGQMFMLREKPDPEWLNSETSLPLIDFKLPPTVMLYGTRQTTLLGIPRTQAFSMNGLVVQTPDSTLEILTAADALPEGEAETDPASISSAEFRVESGTSSFTTTVQLHDVSHDKPPDQTTSLYKHLSGNDLKGDLPAVSSSELRVPTQPEDCCICRSVQNDGIASSVIQSISRDQITANGQSWSVTLETPDLTSWHGAPVVSMADGKIIGIFVASKSGAVIAPL